MRVGRHRFTAERVPQMPRPPHSEFSLLPAVVGSTLKTGDVVSGGRSPSSVKKVTCGRLWFVPKASVHERVFWVDNNKVKSAPAKNEALSNEMETHEPR